MFGNLARIIFHEALVGYLFRERMLNKQELALQLLNILRNIKAGSFSPCDEWRILSRLCRDPASPGRDEKYPDFIQRIKLKYEEIL